MQDICNTLCDLFLQKRSIQVSLKHVPPISVNIISIQEGKD